MRAELIAPRDTKMAVSPEPYAVPASRSLHRHGLAGLIIVTIVGGGITFWASQTTIAGAIVASGAIVVKDGTKLVQHPQGGVVSQILARNEDQVEAGAVLMRLDGTATAAELGVVLSQLNEAIARQARLQAELTGQNVIVEPKLLEDWPQRAELTALLAGQQKLLDGRSSENAVQVERLNYQIEQMHRQIDGLVVQGEANAAQLAIVAEEAENLRNLARDGFAEKSRANIQAREAARLQGEAGRIDMEAARLQASIAEREVARDHIAEAFRTSVMDELQTVSAAVAELMQRKIEAEDRLARLEIRAPQGGVVHSSIVETVGGVVGAGETLMRIVPQSAELAADVRLVPTDIDKVYEGQQATVRLPAFDARVTSDLRGRVTAVAPDLETDPRTGAQYYHARIAIPESELDGLPDGAQLVPGMPTEVFLSIGDRTILAYLVKPLADQISRAFREE
jgi:HlyD family secretion protein